MRHRKGGFKLQRNPSARRALLRGLTTSLILHERIETTVTKAKAVRPKVEQVITLAKRDTLHARRQAAAYLFEPKAVKKLFDTIGPRFADRQGGYTRIMRLGTRSGDGAETAILELLGAQLEKKAETKRRRRESRMNRESDAAAETAAEPVEAAEAAAEPVETAEAAPDPRESGAEDKPRD